MTLLNCYKIAQVGKYPFFIGIFLIQTLWLNAQVTDTTNYFPPPPADNNSGVASVLRSQRHLFFFDITQNTWLKLPSGISTKFISGGFNFSFYYDIFIAKKFFGIAPGISFSNVTIKSNAAPVDNPAAFPEGFTDLIAIPDSIHYLKNKISISYFDIPIEFRFRIKPDERGKNFWFAPGFRGGVLISDFWKQKIEMSSFLNKEKIYNIPRIENLHYGISLHAGYYKFGVYIFYSLTGLFEEGRGTDIVPFSVGISLTPL